MVGNAAGRDHEMSPVHIKNRLSVHESDDDFATTTEYHHSLPCQIAMPIMSLSKVDQQRRHNLYH